MKNNYSFFKRGSLAALLVAAAAVPANAELTCASALPGDASCVMSLSKINLTIDGVPAGTEDFGFEWTSGVTASVKNAEGVEVATAKGASRGDSFVLSVSPAISEKGTYTIEVPEKAFYVPDWNANEWPLPAIAGAENAAFTLTYTVVEVTPVVIEGTEPASGSYMTRLKQLPVTLSGGGENAYPKWTSGLRAEVKNQDGEVMDQYATINNGVVNLNKAITTPGTYTITIPEDAMYVEYEDWDLFKFLPVYGTGNKQTVLTYTIVDASPIVIEGTEPPSGSVMTRLKQLPVTLSGGGEGMDAAWTSGVKATITNQAGEEMAQYATVRNGVVNLNKAITTPGTYTINIPEGALYANYINWDDYSEHPVYGTENSATSLVYTVVEAEDLTLASYSPNAEEAVASFDKVTVVWNGVNETYGFDIAVESVEVKNAAGEAVANATASNVDNNLVLTLDNEINATGVYTILLPEEMIYGVDNDNRRIVDVYNSATTLTIDVQEIVGIAAVSNMEGSVRVVNGSVVVEGFSNASVELFNAAGARVATNNVAPGLYIVKVSHDGGAFAERLLVK
ncbi:MAG: T9SS type A sorting domain-containing protein [Bacteroides sp.]|nr:T9SS type A sorting domain-containing protein [Bacteroides sp.]